MYKRIFLTVFIVSIIVLSITNLFLLEMHDFFIKESANFPNILAYLVLEFMLCLVLSFIFSRLLVNSMINPLYKFSTEDLLRNFPYEELQPFINDIKNRYDTLKNQLKGIKQQKILLLAQNISDGLILLSKQGKILLANKKCTQYLYDIDKISHINECNNELFLQRTLLYLDSSRRDAKQSIDRFRLNDKECEIRFCPIHSKGKFRGMAIVIRDINKLLVAKNIQKEFTANVTHELKTPLTTILASSQMISSNLVKKEDLLDFAHRIENEAKRLLDMIDEMLQLSLLDEDDPPLVTKKLNLKMVIDSVLDRLDVVAKNKGINLISNISDVYITGNIKLIENMVYNLCDNAIKYNNFGGFVKVSLLCNKDKIILSVKDNGIGIPKHAINRIFERFYCVDKSRSKMLGGSGLGLSIVEVVAKYHNAMIDVDSKDGKGSEFKIIFGR